MRTYTIEQHHQRIRDQGMAPDHRDVAFRCPICGTIQSMRSLEDAGVEAAKAESYIGFSCEGRFRDAGPAKGGRPGKPGVRGCDWTLGGLFKLHEIEVVTQDEKAHPTFDLATTDEAQTLKAEMGG